MCLKVKKNVGIIRNKSQAKYVLHIIEKRCYESRTSTPMPGAERARLFWERRKVNASGSLNNVVNTSTAAVTETMDIPSENDTDTYFDDVSK